MNHGYDSLLSQVGVNRIVAMRDAEGGIHIGQYFDDDGILFWSRKPGQEHFFIASVSGPAHSRAHKIYAPTLSAPKANP